jgi:ABC-type uncharacterized transport system permease subunit
MHNCQLQEIGRVLRGFVVERVVLLFLLWKLNFSVKQLGTICTCGLALMMSCIKLCEMKLALASVSMSTVVSMFSTGHIITKALSSWFLSVSCVLCLSEPLIAITSHPSSVFIETTRERTELFVSIYLFAVIRWLRADP